MSINWYNLHIIRNLSHPQRTTQRQGIMLPHSQFNEQIQQKKKSRIIKKKKNFKLNLKSFNGTHVHTLGVQLFGEYLHI